MSELKKAKSRLGRGLSSLLSVSEIPVEVAVQETAPAAPTVQEASSPVPTTSPLEIPITQITPNPHQPRRQFHEASLSELAASVKSNGLIQPIVVRRTGDGYQLVAGERRWRAAKMA